MAENPLMCYSDSARPPLPPIRGGSTDHQDLTLTAADGNRFMAYAARAAQPAGAGMVILPDVRGLHTFYKELARRFAEAGIDAVAIDYFGRTAGLGSRDETFEHMPHVEKTTRDGIAADVAAAVSFLRSAEGGRVRAVFTVGFCFGGANSWAQSAAGHGLAGVIGPAFTAGSRTPLAACLAAALRVASLTPFAVSRSLSDLPARSWLFRSAVDMESAFATASSSAVRTWPMSARSPKRPNDLKFGSAKFWPELIFCFMASACAWVMTPSLTIWSIV